MLASPAVSNPDALPRHPLPPHAPPQTLNIIISIPVGHTVISPMLVIGFILTMGSVVSYTALKMNKEWLKRVDEKLPALAMPTSPDGGAGKAV